MREVGLPGGRVIVHGHYGRPVLVFPAERGQATEAADRGLVDAVGGLLSEGRLKLYCVDSHDSQSWSANHKPLEHRAQAAQEYDSWITSTLVPFIAEDCGGGAVEVAATGVSMGALHALNITLRHAETFVLAACFSGNYDPSAFRGWGERGTTMYFHNPVDYVPHLHGEHLDWLRSRVSVLLVCGQGQWEDSTGALESSKHMAGLLEAKGIRSELDLWGYDVPHDWPSWRAQWAHHWPRFC